VVEEPIKLTILFTHLFAEIFSSLISMISRLILVNPKNSKYIP